MPNEIATSLVAVPIPRSQGGSANRMLWPDLARGTTVLLVVAMHLMYLQLVPLLHGTAATVWHKPIVDWTTPLRMPLFFVVSGYLSARMLQRSWRSGFSGRIAPRMYLYVVWLAITTLSLWGFASWDGDAYDPWSYFLPELVQPTGVLWYIWALAIYFAIARATRSLPDWLVVAVAAAGSILVELVDVGLWEPITSGLLPFLIGARVPDAVRALTEHSDWRQGLGVAGVAIVLLSIRRDLPLPELSGLILSGACVAAVLMLIPRVAHWTVLRPIRHIGRNTLVIFALHPLLIIAANRFIRETPGVLEMIAANFWLAFALPVVELTLVVAVSLLAQRTLRAVGLRHIFEMPRFRSHRRRLRARAAERQSSLTYSSSIAN